jgi:hypothetical protein
VTRLRRILEGDVAGLGGDQAVYSRLRGSMSAFLDANALPRR